MTSAPIVRRTLPARAAACPPPAPPTTPVARTSSTAPAASSRTAGSLTYKGVNFDTDREVWRPEYVRREIAAVRQQLHGNAVLPLGHDLDRLAQAAAIAAAHGLFVWFEPRQFDKGAEQTLAFLGSLARTAEQLRTRHPGVGIAVGTEFGCCTFTGAKEQGGSGFTRWAGSGSLHGSRTATCATNRSRPTRSGNCWTSTRPSAPARRVRLQLHRPRLAPFPPAPPRPGHRQLRAGQDLPHRDTARLRADRAVGAQTVLPHRGKPVPLTPAAGATTEPSPPEETGPVRADTARARIGSGS